jgi:polyhydroxyalkanoate synthesis regulator phasin
MSGFGDAVQKAFYLGVGIASYAGERAGSTLGELRGQAQKLVDEMVARGEMTAEEAQKFVNDIVNRAQAEMPAGDAPPTPRRIEILDDEPGEATEVTESTETTATSPDAAKAEELRSQVEALRAELERLKQQP